ncbi:MAG: arylsulfatase [Lewinellaceae bacterium]|nr:arylsulfatase [Lewinellaceae bacterium]
MAKFFPRVYLICLAGLGAVQAAGTVTPPNIILILADDLGYGELGCYGQQLIETPHIDALARRGIRFTQFYSGSPVCAPARCALLTGQHSGHAFVRGNDEWGARGPVWDFSAMLADPSLEGQRPLPDSIQTVAELLQEGGYRTALVGKWGLGAPGTEGTPNRQGFDFFYGYNCQRWAHTYFPPFLWRNDARELLPNTFLAPHTKLAGADSGQESDYQRFTGQAYAPEYMLNAALDFMEDAADEPFFLYFASPIPHAPLQAPARWVEHYRQKLGPEKPYSGNQSYFPNFTPRATYAAMISYLDEQVGAIVAKVRELGMEENTLILVTSDNGPTYNGGVDAPFFHSAEPFSSERGRTKGYVYEGGIRVPLIAAWPGTIPAQRTTDQQGYFPDFLPTIAALAGLPVPSSVDGINLSPVLRGRRKLLSRDFLYWEFPEYDGQQAIRLGRWKGVRQHLQQGAFPWELYDLQTDPREQNNVAAKHPDIIYRLQEVARQEHCQPATPRFRMAALGDEVLE